MSTAPFAGLRVLDLGHQVAGPYCTKILADLGADVIKIERPGGDPLRAWGPFPHNRRDPDEGGLFRYLNANKRSVVLDLATDPGAETVRRLATEADVVVENFRPGTLESFGLDFDTLREANAQIALVRISNFGQTGPLRDRPATDLVIQAAGGWIQHYAAPGVDPVRVGGRMAEHVSGAFAACAAVTAVHAARRRGEAVVVDLSIQETLVGTLPYPQIAMEAAIKAAEKRPVSQASRGSAGPARFGSFGIMRCKDGWVGINILTDAHWAAACRVAGAPEYAESRGEVARSQVEHEAFSRKVRSWLDGHTAEEILQQCQAARVPTAIVGSGKSLVESTQCTARPFFVEAPGGGFRQPAFPYRMSGSPPTFRFAAPGLASEEEALPIWHSREHAPLALDVGNDPELPFRGLRVLDLGTFWAGPYMGMYLASLGADVVKVESIQRPDGFRFIAAVDFSDPNWHEAGALFQGTNHGKRDVTLDLSQQVGRDLLLRLVESADVVVENFAPRVLERFGLDYPAIRDARPDIVMVRMPAFGLEGPWRDYVGWAMAIAQAAGISWLTGDPADAELRNPGGFLDPA
ncbi:MAG: CoA transferase, partial [Myxococcota bacterium]